MLLDIGPIGDGRASDDPLGLKHGLEQRVTEKRQQLALQVDSLGQYDGRLLLHEVEESAADGAVREAARAVAARRRAARRATRRTRRAGVEVAARFVGGASHLISSKL